MYLPRKRERTGGALRLWQAVMTIIKPAEHSL
jgi:hypothetical protein